jgi:hypothetical protein
MSHDDIQENVKAHVRRSIGDTATPQARDLFCYRRGLHTTTTFRSRRRFELLFRITAMPMRGSLRLRATPSRARVQAATGITGRAADIGYSRLP